MDFIWQSAKSLSSYCKVIYYSVDNELLSFKKTFLSLYNLKKILKFIFSLYFVNFSEWFNFYIFPYHNHKWIEKLNQRTQIHLLKILSLNPNRIVIITPYYSQKVKSIIESIRPIMVIADRVDIWEKNDYQEILKYINCFVTGSPMLYVGQIKTPSVPVFYYSEGHVLKAAIEHLHDMSRTLPRVNTKTIFLSGTITWRLNFKLLLYILEHLPDFKLQIVGSNLMNAELNNLWKTKNKKSMSLWKRVLTHPNCYFQSIDNQNELANIHLRASVGIIPYDINDPFSKYCHPIKLYHYFALGIPVVSTPIRSILHHRSQYCKFATNNKEFVQYIRNLSQINLPNKERERIYKIALKQTYEEKARLVASVIQERLSVNI
jgi:hypothetical protein